MGLYHHLLMQIVVRQLIYIIILQRIIDILDKNIVLRDLNLVSLILRSWQQVKSKRHKVLVPELPVFITNMRNMKADMVQLVQVLMAQMVTKEFQVIKPSQHNNNNQAIITMEVTILAK